MLLCAGGAGVVIKESFVMSRLFMSVFLLSVFGSVVGLWFVPLYVVAAWGGLFSFIGCWVFAASLPDWYQSYIAAESRRMGGY